jgi:hypothetical protein
VAFFADRLFRAGHGISVVGVGAPFLLLIKSVIKSKTGGREAPFRSASETNVPSVLRRLRGNIAARSPMRRPKHRIAIE